MQDGDVDWHKHFEMFSNMMARGNSVRMQEAIPYDEK